MSNCNSPKRDDWRRQGQEKYLKDLKLLFRKYNPYRIGWEHDHCEFCGVKFSQSEADCNQGYSSIDGYHWICVECYNDFKDEFNWSIVSL
jgi:hypothetical protein